MPQKCEQISYDVVFVIFEDLGGPKWSPPIPGVNAKVHLRGKQYGKMFSGVFFYFYEKMKMVLK